MTNGKLGSFMLEQLKLTPYVCRTINTFSRPLPIRENPDVLLRGASIVPVLEGDARSLAVALGYSEYVQSSRSMAMLR